jgi:hypothetical protein
MNAIDPAGHVCTAGCRGNRHAHLDYGPSSWHQAVPQEAVARGCPTAWLIIIEARP